MEPKIVNFPKNASVQELLEELYQDGYDLSTVALLAVERAYACLTLQDFETNKVVYLFFVNENKPWDGIYSFVQTNEQTWRLESQPYGFHSLTVSQIEELERLHV